MDWRFNGAVWCSLWGTNWSVNYYLKELRLQRVKCTDCNKRVIISPLQIWYISRTKILIPAHSSLFNDTFSVTRLYSIDDRVTNILWSDKNKHRCLKRGFESTFSASKRSKPTPHTAWPLADADISSYSDTARLPLQTKVWMEVNSSYYSFLSSCTTLLTSSKTLVDTTLLY
jgi:hypothetical protein